jgi:cytochrome c5
MNSLNSLKPRPRNRCCLLFIAVASFAMSIALVGGADAKPEKDSPPEKGTEPEKKVEAKTAQPEKGNAESGVKQAKPAPKKLTGAELYSMHCNRCHPERYPTERTAAQWKTILLHMRVRANLPAEQARTILKYLQDNSGR